MLILVRGLHYANGPQGCAEDQVDQLSALGGHLRW